MASGPNNAADKFLALLLMVGGAVGIAAALYVSPQLFRQHWLYGLLMAIFVLAFAWTALAGFRLWRGERRGWKWATILFAMQIPVLTVPGMSYEFYTGLTLKLMGGNADKTLEFGLGSNLNFYLDTTITDLVYGINLFALLAAIILFRRRAHYASPQQAT